MQPSTNPIPPSSDHAMITTTHSLPHPFTSHTHSSLVTILTSSHSHTLTPSHPHTLTLTINHLSGSTDLINTANSNPIPPNTGHAMITSTPSLPHLFTSHTHSSLITILTPSRPHTHTLTHSHTHTLTPSHPHTLTPSHIHAHLKPSLRQCRPHKRSKEQSYSTEYWPRYDH